MYAVDAQFKLKLNEILNDTKSSFSNTISFREDILCLTSYTVLNNFVCKFKECGWPKLSK
jgi:hypothetical protein